MPVENTSEPQFELTVNREQWKRVARLDYSGPNDHVYVFNQETGMIRFGDGKQGQIPPAGSGIQATYRYGAGDTGAVDNGPTITLTWTSRSFRKNEVIGVIIEPKVDEIIFRACRESEVSHRWKWIAILCRNIKRWALRITCRSSRSR